MNEQSRGIRGSTEARASKFDTVVKDNITCVKYGSQHKIDIRARPINAPLGVHTQNTAHDIMHSSQIVPSACHHPTSTATDTAHSVPSAGPTKGFTSSLLSLFHARLLLRLGLLVNCEGELADQPWAERRRLARVALDVNVLVESGRAFAEVARRVMVLGW